MGGSDRLLERLTQREIDILRLLAKGLSNREIAQKLILAQGTVKWYNKQLYSKLGVHSREQAVDRVMVLGLLDETKAPLLSGTVTFLFTDIEGSTKLWERHPQTMGTALQQHDALLWQAILANDGCVFKTIGDAICAVFDDAAKALTAAHDSQTALLAHDWGQIPIRVRMALHTGTAELRDGDYFGSSVNHVARLLAAAQAGQILLSSATRALVQGQVPKGLSLRDLGRHRLKDLPRAERIYQLIAPDLPADFPLLNSVETVSNNLPTQLTSFVGRQQEIDDVQQLLASSRLLTLSGPPGTGKTRLALQIARQNLDNFQDGVFFVDLAPIREPQLVIGTIAQALDLQERSSQSFIDTINHYVRDKQMLFLLDNFEQILEVAPLICDLLSDCSDLKVVVTSREPLHVYGEQEYPVPPLIVPDPGHPKTLAELSQFEAVELFCQRARAVKPDFHLTEENISSVCEICARLDGLPLAIELAAARSKLLSPESMSTRLESRLSTLTGGARDLPARMQTLRAAIDWSYDLLERDEQRLLDRLSVFQGGRTIEAVETICNSDLSFAILDGLESLLNKNLLFSKQGRTGETRFYMLETIHEYARDRLAQSGEVEDFEMRHALYSVSLAEKAEVEFHGARQGYWFARLTDELDNFRTTFNWAIAEDDGELGARLVSALRDYCYFKGILSESSAWIDRALQTTNILSPAIWAKTVNASSLITIARGDFGGGARLARQALSIAHDINDKEICAWSHLFISTASMASAHQSEEFLVHAEEGLRLFREIDHKGGIVLGLNTLGELARLDGDYARARQLYEECVALSKELGNRRQEGVNMANLSYVAYHEGDFTLAIHYAQKALSLLNSLQAEHAIAMVLAMLTGPIAANGQPVLAARLLAAAKAQLAIMGARIKPQDKIEIDRYQKIIRDQLGEAEFNKAWAEGWAMSFENAVAFTLGEDFAS